MKRAYFPTFDNANRVYSPACNVNHDSAIDINDIQPSGGVRYCVSNL